MFWQSVRLQILQAVASDPYVLVLDLNENALPTTYFGNKAITSDGPPAFNTTTGNLEVDVVNTNRAGLPLF
jgi:hypothetical protein